MAKHISAFVIGILFSLGLILSGMVNPAKVLGFLDILGDWDASLAFVMGGAVIVNFIGYRIITQRPHPIFESAFAIPTRRDIDMNLVLGSSLFGIGWGLVGLCPGPAITSLGVAPGQTATFVVAMLVGMSVTRLVQAGGVGTQSAS